jgi:prepilin-type N-terminal cleavage/methylation domain-containing protein
MACLAPDIIKQKSSRSGFTMIETIVALGVLSIFFTAITLILQNVLQNIAASRVRSTALALGMQKMETIRNLTYANVGTVGGIPSGPIQQTEQVTINNQVFTVTTSILYIDDPFDRTAPTDTLPDDYKRVRIQITWSGTYPSRLPITLVANISPNGIETTAGGGTLMIYAFNGSGQPVGNATVNIDNTVVSPVIHMQTLTDANGVVAIPGAPACITCYQITVTKNGYSTDKTYSTVEVANPTQPYATVIAGRVTQLSFAIDQVSTLTVNSYNTLNQPIGNVIFTIRGTKTIGHDTSDNLVYKYQYTTNTGGWTVSIPALEWDSYNLDFTNSYHTLAGSNPTLPLALLPNTNVTLPIIAVPKTTASLMLTVKNSAGLLMSSASATLISTPSATYNNTQVTPGTGSANFGQVYFGSLTNGLYNLKVTLPGYQDATSSMTITTNQQTSIKLNPFLP